MNPALDPIFLSSAAGQKTNKASAAFSSDHNLGPKLVPYRTLASPEGSCYQVLIPPCELFQLLFPFSSLLSKRMRRFTDYWSRCLYSLFQFTFVFQSTPTIMATSRPRAWPFECTMLAFVACSCALTILIMWFGMNSDQENVHPLITQLIPAGHCTCQTSTSFHCADCLFGHDSFNISTRNPKHVNKYILSGPKFSTYDHRVWRTELPVRSAALKPPESARLILNEP